MPSLRRCLEPGCTNHVRAPLSRCPLHPGGWATSTSPPLPSHWGSTVKRIKARDGYRCVLCGSKDRVSVDHITPRSQGGSDNDSNLRTLCHSCHALKTHHESMAGRSRTK
jgi:5-methylcytosine-specific restriction endonuclease McrA